MAIQSSCLLLVHLSVILFTSVLATNESSFILEGAFVDRNDIWGHMSQPYFDNSPFRPRREMNITVGQIQAFFNCRVNNLGDKMVAWVRKRDYHVLTNGTVTITSDPRVQLLHTDYTNDWMLEIRFPQTSDSGTYECQVNTEPRIKQDFQLNVVEEHPTEIRHESSGSSAITRLLPTLLLGLLLQYITHQ